MTHSPNTAQAAVPDAVGLPAPRWMTCAASLPHDAAPFPHSHTEEPTAFISSVSAAYSVTYRPSDLPDNSVGLSSGGRVFSSLKRSVLSLERRAELLRGKAGYRALLARLTNARSALLKAENELNR